jgi:hypothetical protein
MTTPAAHAAANRARASVFRDTVRARLHRILAEVALDPAMWQAAMPAGDWDALARVAALLKSNDPMLCLEAGRLRLPDALAIL